LISSPTLRANKDYELQIHACHSDPKKDCPHNWKEIIVNSWTDPDHDGIMIRTQEPEFGLAGYVFPLKEEEHWYWLVVKVLNNGVLDGPHDIENIDPTFTSKL